VKEEEKMIAALLDWEAKNIRNKFTFAVLYCKEGQTHELEMFSNGMQGREEEGREGGKEGRREGRKEGKKEGRKEGGRKEGRR
jgi:hypothetical protein